MAELSRRHLVVSGLAGAGASLLPGSINEANAATSIRYNLASANGQVMLKKYAQAVKLMMALPKSDPRSWTFQWYTHAVPTNTTKAAQISAIFGPNPSPNKTLATAMWDTCQAHFISANEPFFCPWHRMYVCYFEEIIRSVLNDPKFTLPYWNYTSPAAYAVPKEFRMQNDPLWGPLFRPDRNPTSNAGQPIFAFGGSASDMSATPALSEAQYLPSGASAGFNQTLDFGLHGNIHVFTGNSVGMGQVPWAANDPIFWMHHCNIDRIWASWNNVAGHANPTSASWLNKTFVFAGPDGKGVKAVVKDYTNTKKCDYQYDRLLGSNLVVSAAAIGRARCGGGCCRSGGGGQDARWTHRARRRAGSGQRSGRRPAAGANAGGVSLVRQTVDLAGQSPSLSRSQRLQGQRAAGDALPGLSRSARRLAVRSA